MIVRTSEEPPKENRHLARMLVKIGLEVMAQKILNHSRQPDVAFNSLIDDIELDPARNFLRENILIIEWPYYVRKVYDENEKFYYANDPLTAVDALYEYDLLITDEKELFLCMVLKGYEFTINLGVPCIEGYINWLAENNNRSYLHTSNEFPVL